MELLGYECRKVDWIDNNLVGIVIPFSDYAGSRLRLSPVPLGGNSSLCPFHMLTSLLDSIHNDDDILQAL